MTLDPMGHNRIYGIHYELGFGGLKLIYRSVYIQFNQAYVETIIYSFNMREGGGGGSSQGMIQTNSLHFIFIWCNYIILDCDLSLKILGSISWFGSSPVSVAFVYQQPIYNCTATEEKIFRLNKFLVIHKKNLKIYVLFVQEIF